VAWTFKELWARRDYYSGKASDNVRNSAIAGLVAVWLFSDGDDDGLSALKSAPSGLLIAGALFALSLAVDIAHYFFAARTVANFTLDQEVIYKGPNDPPKGIDPPNDWMDRIELLYNAKTVLLFTGYMTLTIVLVKYAIC